MIMQCGSVLKGYKAWFLVNLNISTYDNNNNEVKIALLMCMLFSTGPFKVRNNRKYLNLLYFISQTPSRHLKCMAENKRTLAHLIFGSCTLEISSKKAIFCSRVEYHNSLNSSCKSSKRDIGYLKFLIVF